VLRLRVSARSSFGVFAVFLIEAMKDEDFALLYTEQDACDPVAGKVAPHLPQAVAHGSAKRHPDWPSELNPHEVLPDRVPITFLQRSKPIPHDLGPGRRGVENDRRLPRPVSHRDLYIVHVPYSVQIRIRNVLVAPMMRGSQRPIMLEQTSWVF
jgi:hypothetical protein